ncbi:MAG: hypothetical protein LKK13_01270 [Bacilli bacterium]|jgi:phage FluMu protein Com|nr:hypothetical protein [Bacilli bacterium]
MKNGKSAIAAIYCKKCFKRLPLDKKSGRLPKECSGCKTPVNESKLTLEEKTPLVQNLHRKENHYRDLNDRAMSCIVLGLIFLVIGGIFFSLAYKLDLTNPSDNTRHLTTTTFEFWVSVLSLGGGGVSFVYGLTLLLIDSRHLRVLKHDIASINDTDGVEVAKTGLWLPEFFANSKIIIANKRAIHRAKKEREASEKRNV